MKDNLSRRAFLKGAAAFGVAAASFGVAGVSTGKAEGAAFTPGHLHGHGDGHAQRRKRDHHRG